MGTPRGGRSGLPRCCLFSFGLNETGSEISPGYSALATDGSPGGSLDKRQYSRPDLNSQLFCD